MTKKGAAVLPRLAVMRIVGTLLLIAAVTGCSNNTDTPALPSGTMPETAKIAKDYDPAREKATATEVRDHLRSAGLPCDGKPKMTNRYEDNFGNVLSLTCTVDGHEVSIGVFRNSKEAEAGLAKLSRLTCVFSGDPTFYVADGTWNLTVGTTEDGTTTEATTALIAAALGRPLEVVNCS